ncbi:hypothetical protein NLJ89_g7037 [Agrocybe chaxingu]|uniref:Uncharacterized protein n=1 Tax=Agrocybe chaxingu TaxID=84603 RepID=A0A9W8JXZ4_9AGAR|nr:hypothetical protein NLJ89_g7037 [Agrocybe chaxingu]
MLNPPLSLLSVQLLDSIVDYTAKLSAWWKQVASLALADRAFTARCRTHLFKELIILDSRQTDEEWDATIERKWRVLDDKPPLSRHILYIEIGICIPDRAQVLVDDRFRKISKILNDFPNSGRHLRFGMVAGQRDLPDPRGFIESISLLAPTLTKIQLVGWANLPVEVFLGCPNLKVITLQDVVPAKDAVVTPGNYSSPPKIERLEYNVSHMFIEALLRPPNLTTGPTFDWTSLRVLKVSPHEHNDMVHVQPILNATSETLEKLLFLFLSINKKQLPLKNLVNLEATKKLRAISIRVIINCKTKNTSVLHDLHDVLGTIPQNNIVKTIALELMVYGKQPFKVCLDQDWDGLCREVVRISASKPLDFHLYTCAEPDSFDEAPGSARLYQRLEEKILSAFSDQLHIAFHPLNNISLWQPS